MNVGEEADARLRLRDLRQRVVIEIASKALSDLNAEIRHAETVSLAATALVASGLAATAGFFGSRWNGSTTQIGAIYLIFSWLGAFLWLAGDFAQERLRRIGRRSIRLREHLADELEVPESRLPETHVADLVFERQGARKFHSTLPQVVHWIGAAMALGGIGGAFWNLYVVSNR